MNLPSLVDVIFGFPAPSLRRFDGGPMPPFRSASKVENTNILGSEWIVSGYIDRVESSTARKSFSRLLLGAESSGWRQL